MNRYKYERSEYTIAQCAYLAGIIDGEGSIYIGNFSSNPKTGNKYYQTNIEVSNTDKDLIDWLVSTFGGRIYVYTAKQTPSNSRRTVYRWTISGDRVTHLCEIMAPYIIAKKKQVEIMLKMRATYSPNMGTKKGTQGIQPLDPEVLAVRQSYFEEMQSLHCRNYKNVKT
jgi:hypothetical protein